MQKGSRTITFFELRANPRVSLPPLFSVQFSVDAIAEKKASTTLNGNKVVRESAIMQRIKVCSFGCAGPPFFFCSPS
jgi:hypothetical protein